MPCCGYDNSKQRQAAMKLAKEQVRAKFPDLDERSGGFTKAVFKRWSRIMK